MATKTATSLELRCPFCGADGVFLGLNLNALDVIQCGECSEEFSPTQAREKVAEQLERWERVIRMIEAVSE